jgi:hypothetical protein
MIKHLAAHLGELNGKKDSNAAQGGSGARNASNEIAHQQAGTEEHEAAMARRYVSPPVARVYMNGCYSSEELREAANVRSNYRTADPGTVANEELSGERTRGSKANNR